jgi:hypothetical protein
MSARNDVAPATVGVELTEDGIVVEYVDGREVFYHGPPAKTEGAIRCRPGKDVHVLVTDPTETEGVLVYVNDLKTHDEILKDSGAGRIILDSGEEELFPGVTVTVEEYAVEVTADPAVAGGRVFVFEEDTRGERSYELV